MGSVNYFGLLRSGCFQNIYFVLMFLMLKPLQYRSSRISARLYICGNLMKLCFVFWRAHMLSSISGEFLRGAVTSTRVRMHIYIIKHTTPQFTHSRLFTGVWPMTAVMRSSWPIYRFTHRICESVKFCNTCLLTHTNTNRGSSGIPYFFVSCQQGFIG